MIEQFMRACASGDLPPPVVLPSGEQVTLARLTKFELHFSGYASSRFYVLDESLVMLCFERQCDGAWVPIWAAHIPESPVETPYSSQRAPDWARNLAEPAEPEGEDEECE